MSQIEKWLHKHVPEMIDLFVTPLTTVLATAFLTLGIIGPVFATAETYILSFAEYIITVGHGIGAAVMGAIYPLTVVCGIHHMYNVIEAGMLAAGELNTWMPIATAANFSMGAACLAVGLKSKNMKTKAIAIPSALSAALGITEPAIFGVNLRFVKPFVCGMIGAAAGSLVGAIFGIGATSYGVTGIPGFLITLDYTVQYTILLAVSFAVTFVLTWMTWKEETKEGETAVADKKKVYSPVKGNVIARTDIPDATFASGVLGDGVGIEPTSSMIVAPFDGTITSTTDTKHAVGVQNAEGMELLIHVGVDTVKMNGEGFELFVKEGDTVKKGQKLIKFDVKKIEAAGFSATTAVLLTNSDEFVDFKVVKTGKTEAGEEILAI